MNIEKDIEDLEKRIEHNAGKIACNERKIHQNTGALEILKAFKSDSNKFFIMWIITFFALLLSLMYIVFLLNDITSVETTQEIKDIETIDGNVVNNGDIYGENKANN